MPSVPPPDSSDLDAPAAFIASIAAGDDTDPLEALRQVIADEEAAGDTDTDESGN